MNERKKRYLLFLILIFVLIACGMIANDKKEIKREKSSTKQSPTETLHKVNDSTKWNELESNFSYIQYEGNYGFDEFLSQGGAESDEDVVDFMVGYIGSELKDMSILDLIFGCSTISVSNKNGEHIFGRNFDWNRCDTLVVKSETDGAYRSISTVNLDFISGIPIEKLPEKVLAMIVQYAPLDGMNEKGFVISANMIQDSDTINQDTDKPDITTTTAIRLLLNQAASVDEAILLLKEYDLHASMGYMIHFAMADTTGKSVVVEYIDNKMVVTKTPIVTNFYLADGEKKGIGTKQSHTRFDILKGILEKSKTMSMEEVKGALSSVSKDNFSGYETTEWSIVFNQSTKEVRYYHRENFDDAYVFTLN